MPRSVPTPCDISEPYIGRAGYLASEWGQDTVSVHNSRLDSIRRVLKTASLARSS